MLIPSGRSQEASRCHDAYSIDAANIICIMLYSVTRIAAFGSVERPSLTIVGLRVKRLEGIG